MWVEFADGPDDLLTRGWILRDEEDYGISYHSERVHAAGALVVGAAGVSYRIDAAQDPAFQPGRYLQLLPEPENPVDPNAVAIWDADSRLQIGYVPAESALEVARRLQAGERLYALCLMEFVTTADERRAIRLLIAPMDLRLNFRV